MSDEVKNVPQVPVGLINEILSEGILVRVDQAPWKLFLARYSTSAMVIPEKRISCRSAACIDVNQFLLPHTYRPGRVKGPNKQCHFHDIRSVPMVFFLSLRTF
jgi:hypothetical protein